MYPSFVTLVQCQKLWSDTGQFSIANYFKHLMLYHDQRFAKHPRFRYFALNTQMRHQALQTGRIYVRQNPHDGHLSVYELREMVGHDIDVLSNRMLHFRASLLEHGSVGRSRIVLQQ